MKDQLVLMDTPNIIRARELRDLYNALNYPLLSIDERLQILLHVKFTVKEFDCNLSRDIVELIDREGDLISRGRGEKSLVGKLSLMQDCDKEYPICSYNSSKHRNSIQRWHHIYL
jgi:hypothetical protein